MPDPVAPIETPVAAPETPVAAPVVAPVVETPAAPAPEAAPEAPEAPAAPEAPVAEPTLLEQFEKDKADAVKDAPKPEEAKPEAEKPAAEVPAEPEAPAAPTYTDFTLPEGVTPDKEALSAYTGTLSKYGVSQEGGQELLDLHTDSLRQYAEHVGREQHRIFNETRAQWRNEVLADPEIGGAGHRTAMTDIASMRDLLVPEADRPGFDDFLRITGAGDHPQFLKLLHSAARYLKEPAMAPANIRPPPNHGRQEPRSLRDIYRQTSEAAGR